MAKTKDKDDDNDRDKNTKDFLQVCHFFFLIFVNALASIAPTLGSKSVGKLYHTLYSNCAQIMTQVGQKFWHSTVSFLVLMKNNPPGNLRHPAAINGPSTFLQMLRLITMMI